MHRDLKPSNVLLQGEVAKVADFALASVAHPDGDNATLTIGAALTRTGAFMGTPLYMAPELAQGVRDAQPSSDLWSFGVLAYELLSGRRPFAEAPVSMRLQGRPLPAPPPLTQLDGALQAFIHSCLREDPQARPAAEGFPS